ncbi:hypothetical protein [uncultured Demequina sp.]|uniref:hypothetical protein n=1 Tax=uncultured Demequina sp. TaxID=693499 RepID=UPI0025F3F621|nr:hypothetical protein [uncultured Demequina sp.]
MSKERKPVALSMKPQITEVGAVARTVKCDDGWHIIQTYATSTGWKDGDAFWGDFCYSQRADEELLAEEGWSPEDIEKILTDEFTGERIDPSVI